MNGTNSVMISLYTFLEKSKQKKVFGAQIYLISNLTKS